MTIGIHPKIIAGQRVTGFCKADYIQAPFQRQGLGRALLLAAEARAKALDASSLWLTAWVGNVGALAFYPKIGYNDAGATQYTINGIKYENRIFVKALRSGA